MQIALTASADACQPTTDCLEPSRTGRFPFRRASLRRARLQGGKTLLNLTKCFGLGACITLAASAAHAASEPDMLPPAAFGTVPDTLRMMPTEAMAPVDPLEAVAPVRSIDL